MGRIVSQGRPLGLRAAPSGTAPLQSLYLGGRSSFPGDLLAPLSLAVTWRNLESRALGALLDSILLVPQFVQKCNKIQNLKVQLFRPLGENLGPRLNPRERWIDGPHPTGSMHRSTLGSSAAGASRFGLARPKELRARENDFYCIFERIGHRTEIGQPRLLGNWL